jgi:adenylate cyclase
MSGRLILAWICTAGLPMAGIVIASAGLGDRPISSILPVMYIVGGLGSVAGLAVAVYSGRALTEPIRKVQVGIRSVTVGDLDVELAVTESAELGELQLGFNLMASGLRERERMREVFGHHVGPEVAQRALEGTFSLGGESREATVLFVDIIGSTNLAQQRSPDEVVATLNAFFDAVVRCVGAEGGFVNKFEGDGALCIFGAPVDQPDHANRALRAARALRQELDHLSESFDAAIGISSGEVVAGNVGAADRYEYTVIGDPVNEAARLSEEAKSRLGRVLVSDSAIRNASEEWEHWTQAGTVHLRGRSNPTIAFEPT